MAKEPEAMKLGRYVCNEVACYGSYLHAITNSRHAMASLKLRTHAVGATGIAICLSTLTGKRRFEFNKKDYCYTLLKFVAST